MKIKKIPMYRIVLLKDGQRRVMFDGARKRKYLVKYLTSKQMFIERY